MTRKEAQLKRNVISLEPCFVQDAKMSKLINKIFDDHEKELKQAWIDGSNANYEALKKAGKLK